MTAPPIRDRMVSRTMADPATLTANPLNWRDHPRDQAEALTTALGNVGWLKPVIVNRTTGRIVDGHLRTQVALANKLPLVPVIYLDLTEREEALILATLDPLSLDATTDGEKLRELIQSLDGGELNADLSALLFEIAKRNGAGLEAPPPKLSPGPTPIVCPRCSQTW